MYFKIYISDGLPVVSLANSRKISDVFGWYVSTYVLVFEPHIHVSYSSVVASSWRGAELILKHFVAVVRFIKDHDQGKGKAHRVTSLNKMIRKNEKQYKRF